MAALGREIRARDAHLVQIGVAGESAKRGDVVLPAESRDPRRPSSFTVFTVPRIDNGWPFAIAMNVESEIASINPNPKSGVDWRSAVQFFPKPNA